MSTDLSPQNRKRPNLVKIPWVYLLLFIVAFFLSFRSFQKNDTSSNEALKKKLVTLEKQSWEAWKNHDGKFYERFLSDDHVEVGPFGVSSKAEVVELVSSGRCKVETFSVDSFKMQMLDKNTALLTYHAAQTTACRKFVIPSPVWISSIYTRHGDKWLNTVYQQSWPPADSK
jgi:hypothetical protein